MFRTAKTLTLAGALIASSLAVTSAQAAGWIVGLVDGKSIVTIDPMSRKVVSKVDVKGAASILAIDVRPADGMVYGVASDGNIVTIDVKTGQATMKSKLSETLKAGVTVTVDFNPVADRMRLMGSDGTSLRVTVDDDVLSPVEVDPLRNGVVELLGGVVFGGLYVYRHAGNSALFPQWSK